MIRRFAALAVTAVLALLLPDALPASAAVCGTAPVGTANLASEPEPAQPIWCVTTLAAPPSTGTADGFGGWIDSFGGSGASPAHLADGEAGYHVTDLAAGGSAQSQHFEVNGYFGADLLKTAPDQGTDLSPVQSFTFQNGKLVLEADVAAAVSGFADSSGGDIVWPEVEWSTAPQPSAAPGFTDNLYAYGYYLGGTAAGCRLQATRSLTCAVEADHVLSSTTNDQPPCFSSAPSRVMELSGFQACGGTHSGFSVSFGAPSNAWRVCPAGTVDPCLDRFRFEWSQAGLAAYVNGIKFAEDSGWPSGSQLPAAIVNGSVPVYAHFADFGDFSDSAVYRFHWRQIAVNPHDAAGTPLPPSASPTFGQAPPSPSPFPTATPTPTGTPTPTPSPTPSPTPKPVVVMKGAPCTVGGKTGTCWGAFQPA
jgi:hypothetical protein